MLAHAQVLGDLHWLVVAVLALFNLCLALCFMPGKQPCPMVPAGPVRWPPTTESTAVVFFLVPVKPAVRPVVAAPLAGRCVLAVIARQNVSTHGGAER